MTATTETQAIQRILTAAGVVVVAKNHPAAIENEKDTKEEEEDDDDNTMTSNRRRWYRAMESWLGLCTTTNGGDNDDDDDDDDAGHHDNNNNKNNNKNINSSCITTVEDYLPLSDDVFAATSAWLGAVWQQPPPPPPPQQLLLLPSSYGQRYYYCRRRRYTPKKEKKKDDNGPPDWSYITLSSLYDSVRVTHWICQWNEYNLLGHNDTNDVDDDEDALSSSDHPHRRLFARLLLPTSEDLPAAAAASGSSGGGGGGGGGGETLIRSFYTHLDHLPMMLHHINTLTKRLRLSTTTTTTTDHTTTNTATTTRHVVSMTDRLAQIEAAQQLTVRLEQEWEEHLHRVTMILGELYTYATPPQRRYTRRLLGQLWTSFVPKVNHGHGSIGSGRVGVYENTAAVAIAPTLRLLRRILAGRTTTTRTTNSDSQPQQYTLPHHHHQQQQHQQHEQSLLPVLMALHQPDALVLWRDQTPVLELYHEPLCQCLALLVQANPGLISSILLALPITTGNSTKQVLLLHEVSLLLDLIGSSGGGNNNNNNNNSNQNNQEALTSRWYPNDVAMIYLTQQLGTAMASDNSHIAEQALQLFRNTTFRFLALQRNCDICYPILLVALLISSGSSVTPPPPHWNPTVRKMTLYVLEQMETAQPTLFIETCNNNYNVHSSQSSSSSSSLLLDKRFSLKAGMKGWQPPTTSGSSGTTLAQQQPQPPATITGVAPWAHTTRGGSSQRHQPPATVTGVAPWASRVGEATPSSSSSSTSTKGYDLAKAYMKQLQPKENSDEDNGDGTSYWSRDQMAYTTKLLPTLKFHDLVFGHELGNGAFGVVKYARHIVPNKPRSTCWPEYAVKIVSTAKIRDYGYEQSIQREIAILQLMDHPGIARLVSSFQYSDGVYLVLEYASGGDLHTVLRRQGSLSEAAAKFVMGEILAALLSIHSFGIVYGDLKPENIVLTESGHVKLTDFGAARPVTEAARTTVRANAKELLRRMRDGGWKNTTTMTTAVKATLSSTAHGEVSPGSPMDDDNVDSVEDTYDDVRIEGTTAYLPPEVLSGAAPGLEADAWAFGCVTYQCLTGRPPLLDVDDERTRHRIIRFQDSISDDKPIDANDTASVLFSNDRGSHVGDVAKAFILHALTRSPQDRPTMSVLAHHAFFADMNVLLLYKETPVTLDVGLCNPQPNAQWSRRQMSSIWAPQPKSYDLSSSKLSSYGSKSHESFKSSEHDSPILELEERDGLFVPRQAHTNRGSAGASRKRTNLLPPI